MPVTILPTRNIARKVYPPELTLDTTSLLLASSSDESRRCKRMIQSSFNDDSELQNVKGSENGFVDACSDAYNNHHHLVIRPEDVWFAILSQLGFYINGNAEELRKVFVSHEGKMVLSVPLRAWEDFPLQIMGEMAKHLNDPEWTEWVQPDFSTTTPTDLVIASILLMGGMQKYFQYDAVTCGLPSATLLGTRDDWQRLFHKVDRLTSISDQATTFHSLLKPVLGYFVRSFDEPKSKEVISFWNRIVHKDDGGSGPAYLSGWITAFCFWNFEGKMLYIPPGEPRWKNGQLSAPWSPIGCNLDGTLYHQVDMDHIAGGYMGVPVNIVDGAGNLLTKCRLVAGSVGIRASTSDIPRKAESLRSESPKKAESLKSESPKKIKSFKTRLLSTKMKLFSTKRKVPRTEAETTVSSTQAETNASSTQAETKASSPQTETTVSSTQAETNASNPQTETTVSSTKTETKEASTILNTVQPLSGWWLFETGK